MVKELNLTEIIQDIKLNSEMEGWVSAIEKLAYPFHWLNVCWCGLDRKASTGEKVIGNIFVYC